MRTDPAGRHREIAAGFTTLTQGVDDWASLSPVPGWRAVDVVDHLVTWLPALLEGGSDASWPPGPAAESDPVGAWIHQCAHVQAILDAEGVGQRVLSNPHFGEVPLDQAIDRFYTTDVFLHTWDLAEASRQQANLSTSHCEEILNGMQAMEGVLRSSGQYGPAVEVPAQASAQDRLMGFIGRDPLWRD